jgi:hypothetical protein
MKLNSSKHTSLAKIGGTRGTKGTKVNALNASTAKVRADQTAIVSIATDEIMYAEQPSVMRRVAGTTAGVLLVAYMNGTTEPMRLGVKAVYSLVAQAIGLNAEIFLGIPHVEHLITAGVYYASDSMSFSPNNKIAYEAIGGGIGGFAAMSMA